jgi:hypothetical protein
VALAGVAITLSGCVSYKPPPPLSSDSYIRHINAPFNHAWTQIVSSAARSSAQVMNSDKASGLILLQMQLSDYKDYVDCGHNEGASMSPKNDSPLDVIGFGRVILAGNGSVVVRPDGPSSTSVQLTIQYTLTGMPSGLVPGIPPVTWHFNSRTSDTREIVLSTADYGVTCEPTGKAERELLDFLTGGAP